MDPAQFQSRERQRLEKVEQQLKLRLATLPDSTETAKVEALCKIHAITEQQFQEIKANLEHEAVRKRKRDEQLGQIQQHKLSTRLADLPQHGTTYPSDDTLSQDSRSTTWKTAVSTFKPTQRRRIPEYDVHSQAAASATESRAPAIATSQAPAIATSQAPAIAASQAPAIAASQAPASDDVEAFNEILDIAYETKFGPGPLAKHGSLGKESVHELAEAWKAADKRESVISNAKTVLRGLKMKNKGGGLKWEVQDLGVEAAALNATGFRASENKRRDTATFDPKDISLMTDAKLTLPQTSRNLYKSLDETDWYDVLPQARTLRNGKAYGTLPI